MSAQLMQVSLQTLDDRDAASVPRLLARGAKLEVWDPNDPMTPLQSAASRGQAKVVAALIAAGAKVDSRGGMKVTPLYLAADYGHVQACRVLLDAKADWRAPDKIRRTPMIRAAENGHGEVILLFLGYPQVQPSDKELGVVLRSLAVTSTPQNIAKMLDRLGASQDRAMEVFWAAVKGGNLDVVKHLVQHGADWRAKLDGRSALQLARRDAHDLKRFLRSLRTQSRLGDAMIDYSETAVDRPSAGGPSPL